MEMITNTDAGAKVASSPIKNMEKQARFDAIIDKIFPRHCFVCGETTSLSVDFCAPCLDELPRIEQACPRCGVKSSNNRVCGKCQQSPPVFRQCIAPFLYTSPMDRFIQQIKFRQRLDLLRSAAFLLVVDIQHRDLPMPDALLPVPLHPSRLRTRGFNQSLEIARVLSHYLKIPVLQKTVVRNRATRPQTGLPFSKRKANIKGAFEVKKSFGYQSIAIIDDVMTTGSTADELARCLHQAGVQTVDVWAIART